MPSERAGFFRGNELPRLLLLAAVAVGGIIAAFAYLNREAARPEPPAAPRPMAGQPLPPADDSEEFQGLVDKTPMSPRDNPAYLKLIERVRATPPAELDREGRRDVLFSQLIDVPSRYRGLPIHLEGTILRVLRQDATDSKLFPQGHFFEAHMITPDSQNFPYMLAFEQAPPDLPIGDDVRVRAGFVGYFFKLFAYASGDGRRFAPLLVGRLRWIDPLRPATGNAPPAAEGAGRLPGGGWVWAALIGFAVYMVLRWGLFLRKAFAPVRRPPNDRMIVTDRIDPDALADWLNTAEDGALGDEEDADNEPPQRGGSWRS